MNHNQSSTPKPSPCQPESFRADASVCAASIVSAASVLAVWLYSRTKLKIEREKLKHDCHVTAVTLALEQDKVSLKSCQELGLFILDLNIFLHPGVFQRFFHRITRRIKNISNAFQGFFKFGNAFFKLSYSFFHKNSSSGRFVDSPTVDEAGGSSNAVASSSDLLRELNDQQVAATCAVRDAVDRLRLQVFHEIKHLIRRQPGC